MWALRQARRLALRFLSLHGEPLAGDIVKAISMVAFLFAVDYFTEQPSVNSHVWGAQEWYYQKYFRDFFIDNEITPPSILNDDSFSRLLDAPSRLHGIMENPQAPDIDYIQEIQRREDSSASQVYYRIEELESQLDTSRYTKHAYLSPDLGAIWMEAGVKQLLHRIDSVAPPLDYYIVLAAMMYSQTYRQHVAVKNDGHVDLRNVDVTIPAPLSRISQLRDGNILYWRVIGDLLCDVDQYPDRIALHIPTLKQGQYVGVEVLTRENELIDSDLSSTFESDRKFSRITIGVWVLALLVLQWLIRWWCCIKKIRPHP